MDGADSFFGEQAHEGIGITRQGKANQFGARFLLQTNFNASRPLTQGARVGPATFVQSWVFPRPLLWRLQAKFAAIANAPNYSPLLPFQWTSSNRVKITIRRTLDPRGSIVEDTYIVNGFTSDPNEPQWLPVSTVAARQLTVIAENIDTAAGHAAQWVDISATPVEATPETQIITERSSLFPNINGYGTGARIIRVAATNVAAIILGSNAARRQFFVINEASTRMALGFGTPPDVTVGAETWNWILDAKGGAQPSFQGVLDGFWGDVWAVWEGAPTGFGVISEGTIE